MGYPSSRNRSTSRRTVRGLTCKRSASSRPGQSRRACNSDSNASSLAEVLGTNSSLPVVADTSCPLPLRESSRARDTGRSGGDEPRIRKVNRMSIQTTTHLNFRGEAREALEFYRKVFGGDLVAVTYADTGNVPDETVPEHVMWGQV